MQPRGSEATRAITVANAPVSFGVFELTAGRDRLPPVERVIDAVAEPGYDGIDLGPLGYLGLGPELRARLEPRGLSLAGGWVQLHFLEPEVFEEDLGALRLAIETFRAGSINAHPPPRPTLADAGSPARWARPGHAAHAPELRMSGASRARLHEGIERAAETCRAAGLEPTFHHHAGTHVESVEEVEAFLEGTDVGLCLDTGHLIIGGGDPLAALESWRDRINHVHIKDVDRAALCGMVARGASMEEIWDAGVFPRLGTGDVDVPGFTRSLLAGAYEGWVVVEQDRVLKPQESFDAVAREQANNLEYLRGLGL